MIVIAILGILWDRDARVPGLSIRASVSEGFVRRLPQATVPETASSRASGYGVTEGTRLVV